MNETLLIVLFVVGYACIALEHWIGVNKAAAALLMAVATWTLLFVGAGNHEEVVEKLAEHLSGIAQIVFFLIGAMTIVELLSAYRAFDVLQRRIARGGNMAVLWGLPLCAFFMSAVLDNVTTTILMISILRPLVFDRESRLMMAGVVVIAANAGGAWSPIGDVTTTMLWIDERVSTGKLVSDLILPSLASLLIPLALIAPRVAKRLRGNDSELPEIVAIEWSGLMLVVGIGSLLFVPVLKVLTGLPPYVGVLLGLGLVWALTDVIGAASHLRVPHVLARIDISSVLFFLGILLAVSALETAGTLTDTAKALDESIGNSTVILTILGLLSAIVDNVPLTAAVIGMYDPIQFPTDDGLWHLTAYCVGTGGSILIIGSAAGVVAMGMEKIAFGWYLVRIGGYALVGYLGGIGVYLMMHGHP